MNYSRAFSYVFEDKNWLSKLLIAGLISLIPIIGQFYLLGWMVEIIRRVRAGRTDILPTTHFAYFLTLGLKAFVVCLIYSLPLIFVTGIVSVVRGNSSYEGSSVTIVVTNYGFLGSMISLLVQIAVAFFSTYGFIKLAETDQIGACLNIKDGFNTIKENLTAFIIVELLSLLAGIISSAGLILCFIGIIFTMPYGTAITGHLLGQLWCAIDATKSGNRPTRGSVNEKVEDIIEEAPFTRVQDIEQKVVNAEPVVTVEPTPAAEENTPSVEVNVPSVEETAPTAEVTSTAAEESAPAETEETVQPSAEQTEASEEKSDTDLPSFE